MSHPRRSAGGQARACCVLRDVGGHRRFRQTDVEEIARGMAGRCDAASARRLAELSALRAAPAECTSPLGRRADLPRSRRRRAPAGSRRRTSPRRGPVGLAVHRDLRREDAGGVRERGFQLQGGHSRPPARASTGRRPTIPPAACTPPAASRRRRWARARPCAETRAPGTVDREEGVAAFLEVRGRGEARGRLRSEHLGDRRSGRPWCRGSYIPGSPFPPQTVIRSMKPRPTPPTPARRSGPVG